ncbi:MAG: VWA domain-containing protein [Candidatus Omnitrophica bacterium]|nr:VWA domain-containing protein [Candidatus Omnitrophota bacterium]
METKKIWKALVVLSFALFVNCRGAEKKPIIQMAILLDTSGSMEGLINQARSQLWTIVNEFSSIKKSGERPELQVALFEYGNTGLSAKEGWIRLIVPFTADLDKVSEELFALRTNGGDEYCGWVIKDAVGKLQWSKSSGDYKVIFIAGNEPFTQGSVNYKETCKSAISRGIIVNTIHCGEYQSGVNSGWKDGADIAEGVYANIDQDKTVAYIEAPQDKAIEALGLELNKTYLAYGMKGAEGKKRQADQETNAAAVSEESLIVRQVAKASASYTNSGWDLVDAVKEKAVRIEALKKSDLPEEMKNMNEKERDEYVKNMSKKRTEIQNKIKNLNSEREKFLAKKRTESSGKGTLNEAFIKALRTQAKEKQFTLK